MSGWWGKVLGTTCALAVAACGGSSPEASTSIVRDSAGVTIIENRALGSVLGWDVAAAPQVSIGTLDGAQEYQLYRVADAMRRDDGALLVANGGTNEVRVYEASGTFVDAWGGEGEGPGEFTGLSTLDAWPGDSVVAYDIRQRRLTIFGADGTVGRTVTLETGEGMAIALFRGVLSDGTLAAVASTVFRAGEAEAGLVRRDQAYARFSPEGARVGSLGTHPGSESYVRAGESFVSVMAHPYGRSTSFAVWNELVIIAANDDYQLRAYDTEGDLARIVRLDRTPTVPTQADLDAYVEARLEDVPEDQRARTRQMYEGMPNVESAPAYGAVQVDAEGYLWVADFTPRGADADAPTSWTVFDPEGSVVGRVETPAGLTVREIGADYVLGTAQDDFEVEYVRLHGLTRVAS